MSDLISTQESVVKIVDTAIRKILSGEQKLTKEYEQSVIEAVDGILDTARRERSKTETRPKIVRCKDCLYGYCEVWLTGGGEATAYGYCGRTNLRVLPYDYCSKAERKK